MAFWNPTLTPSVRIGQPGAQPAAAEDGESLFSTAFPAADAPPKALTLFSDGLLLSAEWETFLNEAAAGDFGVVSDFEVPSSTTTKKKKSSKKSSKKSKKKKSEGDEPPALPFLVCNGVLTPLRSSPPPLEHALTSGPLLPCAREYYVHSFIPSFLHSF